MALDNAQKTLLYRNLVRADHYNRMMYRRMMQGKLIGFYHPAEGAIAPGVGASSFLNQDDNHHLDNDQQAAQHRLPQAALWQDMLLLKSTFVQTAMFHHHV